MIIEGKGGGWVIIEGKGGGGGWVIIGGKGRVDG